MLLYRLNIHRVLSVLLFAVAVSISDTGVADPFGTAAWLRDPIFQGTEPLDVFASQQSGVSGTDLRNVHTYFRKEVDLPAKPVKAMLYVTGDDYYKLHIDDQFIVQGPEPAYPFAHPYYAMDIADYLDEGINCLASHAYYHGLVTRAFNSADNRSGFMLSLELTYPDGSTETIATDDTWKCYNEGAFTSDEVFGYQTQFNENINMSLVPAGWREVGFDDSLWQTPLIERQDHLFEEQITAPLEHWRADPVVVKEKSEGRYFLDFGAEVVGHTRIRIQGNAGDVITVWHGEELSDVDTVRHDMRANCDYEDKITLSGQEDLIEFYDYRGFRYVEILNAPSEPQVWVDVRHHPFDENASRFDSSDELLNRIWGMCKRGIQMGCQGVMVDCPTREKGQYTGDAYMTALSHLTLTADPTLTKKAIKDFQRTQRFDDGLLAVAPGGFHQELAEWSLLWPVMLNHYYQETGDKDLVCEMVDIQTLNRLFTYFGKLESENGLLTNVDQDKWVLIDWPANLRGGYDYENTKNSENTVVNAFYYRSLREAAELMRVAGHEANADAYDAKADRLREAFVERLLDPETGLFRDGSNSDNFSLHASAFALDFGLVPEENVASVVEMIRTKRLDCGLYAAPYVIEGLFKAGEGELAYDLITSTDKHSWNEMLESGATTPLEAWAPELKWNTSWCHPACATPVYLIARYVLGLEPGEPGWKTIRVSPQIPESLDHIELTIPIPDGSITAEYTQEHGYCITVPAGVSVVGEFLQEISVYHRPVEVLYASGDPYGNLPEYTAEMAIDGDPDTFACLLDDTLDGDSTSTTPDFASAPTTGYMIFDMGQAADLAGVKLTARAIDNSNCYNPKNVDFFYFADGVPCDNPDIEGDDNLIPIASLTFSRLFNGAAETLTWDSVFTRYIGMRINSSYTEGPVHFNFQIGEISFLAAMSELVPGDANGDGVVDGSDVTILAGNWQMLSGATWAMGDFNGDGAVDGSDVTILAGNWQHGVTEAAVAAPEPSAGLMILLGVLCLAIIVQRRGVRQAYGHFQGSCDPLSEKINLRLKLAVGKLPPKPVNSRGKVPQLVGKISA